MRLFTALDVPDPVRDRCAACRDDESLDARWSPPANYHVTLRFIGEVNEDAFPRYRDAVASVNADPVTLSPYGLDVLPSRRSPRVLMVGMDRTDSLLALHTALSDALAEVGLDREDRTYRPHVTLARLNDASPEAVHQFLRAHDLDLPTFTVSAFHLYESTLTPDGAVHEPRATLPLTESGSD
jgi:2'-5' RNA ligase